MNVEFKNIPTDIRFEVFDKGVRGSVLVYDIAPGDSNIQVNIPETWSNPSRNIVAREYYISSAWAPINDPAEGMLITGSDFYIDVTRAPKSAEFNQKDIENLIVQVYSSDNLSGRQKFYVALVSLQSYFEYLVYGMLVLSGHFSKTQFKNLSSHECRTNEAFSPDNTDFFPHRSASALEKRTWVVRSINQIERWLNRYSMKYVRSGTMSSTAGGLKILNSVNCEKYSKGWESR